MITLPRGETKSSINISNFQVGIVLQDFFVRGSACEQFKDIHNPYAKPTDTRLTPTNVRVNCNSFFHIFGFRDRPLKSSIFTSEKCATSRLRCSRRSRYVPVEVESTLKQSRATQIKPTTRVKHNFAGNETP